MRIHFIAIGGAVMHNLAIALKRQGHTVTGSDDKIMDPALRSLQNEGLMPAEIGFFADRISSDIEAVILGMHARVDNPELLRAQELGIAVYSFPHFLYEVSRNKTRVVIAGSHGKTTITAMVMHVLKEAGYDFDYVVGARVPGFDTGVRLSEHAPIIVLEGDEYLASPIHRESKFMFYKPQLVLISGIAWDHINVFPEYAGYVNQFRKLVQEVQPGGYVTAFAGDETLQAVLGEGVPPGVEYESYPTLPSRIEDGQTILMAEGREWPLAVFGEHNVQNISGAFHICRRLNVIPSVFFDAISRFTGAANRLQFMGRSERAVIYKDFAHSPSKVSATVLAVRNQFANKKMVAVLELHTFSSLNPEFMKQYRGSLSQADVPVVFYDAESFQQKQMPLPDSEQVLYAFGDTRIRVITGAPALLQFLKNENWKGDVLLMMSSGHFAGLDLTTCFASVLH